MKDAKGHGSDSRGGGGGKKLSMEATIWRAQLAKDAAARSGGSPMREHDKLYGEAATNRAMFGDAWSNTPGGDREAAGVLSSGGPKSEPAPVHEAMHHAMHNSYGGVPKGETFNVSKNGPNAFQKSRGANEMFGRSMKIDGREG
jgi:hypothetical protein